MANRYTLHKNSLEDFQSWLVADGWEIEKPKGIYEVLRARKAGRQQPLIVYTKADAKEHLTVMDRDLEIVGAFLRDKKKPQTNADRIRSMTDEELAEFLPIASNFICQPTEECIRNTVMNHCGECERTEECAMKWLRAESEG